MKTAGIYQEARRNPVRFWEKQAWELTWIKPWKKALQWKEPFAKWFIGGKLNASANCLDRHVAGPRRTKAALIWEGEPEGQTRTLTYFDLYRDVNRFAAALQAAGVQKGEIVTIYMPTIRRWWSRSSPARGSGRRTRWCAVGRRVSAALRSLVAAPARHRGRAHQPGGVGLVLEGDRGRPVFTPLPGVTVCKPGSATLPFPGIEPEVVNTKGEPAQAGYLVLKRPWPEMLRGVYGDPELSCGACFTA